MVKVLIVEDDPTLRQMLVEELKDAGHIALEAGDGAAGLAVIKAESPDMVISDIGMPRMNGHQLWRALQRCSRFDNRSFFFLSALPIQDTINEGITLHADHYFRKPVDFLTLLSRINAFAG